MTRTLYLVRKAVVYADGDFNCPEDGPGFREVTDGCNGVRRTTPVGLFANRQEAAVEAARLEAEARDRLNPWLLRSCTSQLVRVPAEPGPGLAALGVVVPEPDVVESQYGPFETTANQSRWYDEHAPAWTPEVRSAVWQAVLGDRGFYEVVEVPFEDEP